ncbi:dihydroorotate dehydrogenase [bacterium]|nr:dihydroorotate dehydrogenase [bacterium]
MSISSAETVPSLAVDLTSMKLATPAVLASGTWGYGPEGSEFVDYARIGAIAVKGVTRQPRAGNPPPRLRNIPSGVLNSVGLENVGVDALLAEKLPAIRDIECSVIVNFAGGNIAEYGEIAAMLVDGARVDALEANVSCPNVEAGGKAFGTNPAQVREIARVVKDAAPKLPLFMKLAPGVTDIVEIVDAAMAGGADGVTIANCWLGLSLDVRRRRPIFRNIVAGMSGPAVKPLTLRLVHEVHKAMPGVPIIGLGGVNCGEDVAEYLLAGASAVGIGAASLAHPGAAMRIVDEFEQFLREENIERATDLVGALGEWEPTC